MFRLFDKDVEREEEELQNFIDFTLITTERQNLITSGTSER